MQVQEKLVALNERYSTKLYLTTCNICKLELNKLKITEESSKFYKFVRHKECKCSEMPVLKSKEDNFYQRKENKCFSCKLRYKTSETT